MSFPRALTLTLGPLLLVGLCYVVAAPPRRASVAQERETRADVSRIDDAELQRQCQSKAGELRRRSQPQWSVFVQPPYVLAGDLSPDELESLYRQTVAATAQALQIDYFDRKPPAPITLLILATDESYQAVLKTFGHARRAEYSGLYVRDERTVILNLSTGAGTVAHELTHALAHADFPDMPEWFDEGLASLHEESEFTADGRHLIGRDNWRSRFLREADQRGCWKTLDRLFDQPFAEPDLASLDYALARNLCVFLQDRSLLPAYYRKCRSGISQDATGRDALLQLFPGKTLADIDTEFRAWLRERSNGL